MAERLDEIAVQSALSTGWLGRSYHYRPTIGSTNDRLKEMAAASDGEELPAGTVLLANFQSHGRGRLNRRWQVPAGTSLLFSVLFRPNWPADRANWLIMATGVAAVEAVIAESGLMAGLKWPNDLMVDVAGEWRKAGGLLLEGNLSADGRLESAILGIGINVNVPAEQLPEATVAATSLLVAGGRPVSRLALLVTLLERLEAHYEAADRGQSPQVAWLQHLITLGQAVQVTNAVSGQTLRGIAEGTDDSGHLLLRDEREELHRVSAGDVTLRPATNAVAQDRQAIKDCSLVNRIFDICRE